MKYLKNRTCTVIRAAYIPNFPISEPIYSSFSCNGVASTLIFNFSKIYPRQLLLPTDKLIKIPSPDNKSVPESRIGEGRSCAPLSSSLP